MAFSRTIPWVLAAWIAASTAMAQDVHADGSEAPVTETALTETGSFIEGDPIDDAMRAEQQQAGLMGLGIWTLVGLGLAAWIGLRWKLPRG